MSKIYRLALFLILALSTASSSALAQPLPQQCSGGASTECKVSARVSLTAPGDALSTTAGNIAIGAGTLGALIFSPGNSKYNPAITPRSGTLVVNGSTVANGDIFAAKRMFSNQGFGVNVGSLRISNSSQGLWTTNLSETGNWSRSFPWSPMSTLLQDGVAAGAVGSSGFLLFDNIDSAAATGPRIGIVGKMQVSNSPRLDGDVVAGGFYTIISSPFGNGSAFATAPVVDVAGHLGKLKGGVSAEEIDVRVGSGTYVPRKIGLTITQLPKDASRGGRGDEAILLGNAPNTPGWKLGLAFGDYSSTFPVSPDGTLIGVGANSQGPFAAAHGIDLSSVTFSEDSLKLPGFAVSPTGHILSSGRTPVATGCGDHPHVQGTDTAGIVSAGAGKVTSCTVRFVASYGARPVVTITPEGRVPVAVSVSPSAAGFTAYFSSSVGAQSFAYMAILP